MYGFYSKNMQIKRRFYAQKADNLCQNFIICVAGIANVILRKKCRNSTNIYSCIIAIFCRNMSQVLNLWKEKNLQY